MRAVRPAAALVAASCTAGREDRADPVPAVEYAEAPCPAGVSALIVAEVSCGYLTVPENRAGAESDRTIRLLVTRVQPPEPPAAEPMLVAGSDLGSTLD